MQRFYFGPYNLTRNRFDPGAEFGNDNFNCIRETPVLCTKEITLLMKDNLINA